MWYGARVFLYGSVFFAGPPALMDLFHPRLEDGSLFWGLRFLLVWGAVGGLLFLVSALSWHMLKTTYRELIGA